MNEFNSFLINFLMLIGANGLEFGCKSEASVFREFEREGFHFYFHYLIELIVDVETASQWENCSVVLREHITNSFYASPDQLSELSRHGVSHACTTEKVNIEAPQHLSKPHTVYVYGRFNRSRNLIYTHLTFPMHLRYHEPKIDGSYSLAETKLPLLLIRCPNIDCKNLQKSKAPCFNCGEELCTWNRFSYKTNNNTIKIFVPVGNLNDLWFVKPITYIITFGACCYILLISILKSKQ